MRKSLVVLPVFLCLISVSVSAQNSLSFYHLGNKTFQNTFQNAAYVPEGKLFIGLPVISGTHLNFNNKFSYSDVIVKTETERIINLNFLLTHLQKDNLVSSALDINLLHVALTTPSHINYSFFINERVEADFSYPRSLMQFIVEGNVPLAGETLKLGNTRLTATHFREFGVGIALPHPALNLTVGARLKYLHGLFNISSPRNFKIDVTNDALDYTLQLEMENARVRTAGLEIASGRRGNIVSHLLTNSNRGASVDFGMHWEMDAFNAISLSVSDVGFIRWKENTKNYIYNDTTFEYSGIDLRDPGNVEQQLQDSLFNRLRDRIDENNDPYTAGLSPKLLLSWTLGTPIGGHIITTGGTRLINGQFKYLAGLGYRHGFGDIFTGTVNLTKLPQQFLNIGAAIAVKGGPAQLYLAVDQVVNYDATKFQAIDVRLGINLIFGKHVKKAAKQNAGTSNQRPGVNTSSFLGSQVRTKGTKGVYSVIDKQKRRGQNEFRQKGKKKNK